MNHGNWNDGWGGGSGWWMAIMMIAVMGGLVWIAIALFRHGSHTSQTQLPGAQPALPARATPKEILAERLARGEIEPDEYRSRLEALQHLQDK